ncbi:aminotransferase class IV [Acidocella sp. KAb 2-4]|uniref:aminotransferase class IV n=1 Tax=Acidocella sp. KAb 2-4 TaxID=2885158 RepID=UPI001D06A176|nr:aminotransferase class IV [Acidocella sp. KAb 2-4]MCB5945574.1 aminotransferase class IV [Acidocella sp. KAb 2-4]
MKLWLNGALLNEEEARIAPSDRGFLLGDGLFETMAAEAGRVPELKRHYQRLCAGAALLRLPVTLSRDALAEAVSEVLRANALASAALRFTLTRGAGPRGLLPPADISPTLLLTAAPLPPPGGAVRLLTSTIRRDEDSPLSAIKSLNYLPNVLARMEAAERGADDALLLNRAGRVAETSAASLFVRLRGQWLTPPVADGALPGIRRAMLLEAGKVCEARVTLTDLNDAEALCIGNVLSLRPVTSLDGRAFPQVTKDELDDGDLSAEAKPR